MEARRLEEVAGVCLFLSSISDADLLDLIAAAPKWRWSQLLAALVVPLLIALVWTWSLLGQAQPIGGGFSFMASRLSAHCRSLIQKCR